MYQNWSINHLVSYDTIWWSKSWYAFHNLEELCLLEFSVFATNIGVFGAFKSYRNAPVIDFESISHYPDLKCVYCTYPKTGASMHTFHLSRSKMEYMKCKFSWRHANANLEVKIRVHTISLVTWFKYVGSIIQNH